jgi:hypothetical protein
MSVQEDGFEPLANMIGDRGSFVEKFRVRMRPIQFADGMAFLSIVASQSSHSVQQQSSLHLTFSLVHNQSPERFWMKRQ